MSDEAATYAEIHRAVYELNFGLSSEERDKRMALLGRAAFLALMLERGPAGAADSAESVAVELRQIAQDRG